VVGGVVDGEIDGVADRHVVEDDPSSRGRTICHE